MRTFGAKHSWLNIRGFKVLTVNLSALVYIIAKPFYAKVPEIHFLLMSLDFARLFSCKILSLSCSAVLSWPWKQSSFLCEISDRRSAVFFSRARFSKLYSSLMKDLVKKSIKKISSFVNLLPNIWLKARQRAKTAAACNSSSKATVIWLTVTHPCPRLGICSKPKIKQLAATARLVKIQCLCSQQHRREQCV